MYRCLIVADDLTGANASGVLLRPLGIRPMTLVQRNPTETGAAEINLGSIDAVVVSTDSRGLPPDEAYCRVREATLTFSAPEVRLYTKRIDSTMRGNVGAEIDAMLDALEEKGTHSAFSAVVPAYPQAGRVLAGGYLLVNGVPLERSDANRDPKAPVATSLVSALIEKQSKRRVGHIPLVTIYLGPGAVAESVREAYARGVRICVFDAVQPEDLDSIAQAVLAVGHPFIASDPGPFTAALAGRLWVAKRSAVASHILAVVGSVVETTMLQLRELYRAYHMEPVYLDPEKLLSPGEAEDEICRAGDAVVYAAGRADFLCLTTNNLDPASLINLDARARGAAKESVSNFINEGIAAAVDRALNRVPTIGGLFLSGGDTAMALLRYFGAAGFTLEGEVMPLAAFGRVVGGRLDGMPIVTKGGMVGDNDAIKMCMRYLRDEASGSKSR